VRETYCQGLEWSGLVHVRVDVYVDAKAKAREQAGQESDVDVGVTVGQAPLRPPCQRSDRRGLPRLIAARPHRVGWHRRTSAVSNLYEPACYNN
jgi:hypothetical protein